MPASAVHGAHEEKMWNEAKESAKAAGKGKDFAYIMGTFQHMKQGTGSKPTHKTPIQKAAAERLRTGKHTKIPPMSEMDRSAKETTEHAKYGKDREGTKKDQTEDHKQR